MSEFVKLTGTVGGIACVRKADIIAVHQNSRADVSVIYIGDMSDDHVCYVTETPEQIMALIDGPTDRGALVDAMRKIVRFCRDAPASEADAFNCLGAINAIAMSALGKATQP